MICMIDHRRHYYYYLFSARTAFEKLTDHDYRGTTYYSVRNLSLYECQGWCREEPECQAAAFSFVVNPLAPMQDTLCQLQNETAATNPSSQPQRAVNMYYMTKLQIRSGAYSSSPSSLLRTESCSSPLSFTAHRKL